jgi:hypothetical protein
MNPRTLLLPIIRWFYVAGSTAQAAGDKSNIIVLKYQHEGRSVPAVLKATVDTAP